MTTTTADLIAAAVHSVTTDTSEITATDIRAAADWIRATLRSTFGPDVVADHDSEHVATGPGAGVYNAVTIMVRVADALDASADDMDRPVRLSDVLETFATA